MGRFLDPILHLSGPAAYGIVGLLAFGEAAAFIGLLLPGELAVLLGGVVVASGNASLWIMIVVTSIAAVAGDSAGYEIGRRFGPRIVAWPPFARRFADKVEVASQYLEAKGGRAVFLGRWTSLLRALIPGIAGMARMPYGRFLVFNVLGGVLWATTFVLAGYAAGASWRRVERVAGQASLILLVLVVAGLLIRWATRWLASHSEAVRARFNRLRATAPVRWALDRFAAPLGWLGERATPGATRGLGWTISVLVATAAAAAFGVVVRNLLGRGELALLDFPVSDWLIERTTSEAASVARTLVAALAPPWGVWFVLVAAAVAWRGRDRRAAGRVVVAAVLATIVATVLHPVMPVTVSGTLFPASGVTWLTAAVVAVVAALASQHLKRAIRIAGVGTGVVVVAAMAELVAGDTTLSGVVGALGVGMLVGVGGEVTTRTIDRPGPPRSGDPRGPVAPDHTGHLHAHHDHPR